MCRRLAAEARTLSWDSTACMFLLITVQPRWVCWYQNLRP